MPTRDELHLLIDSLPDAAIPAAHIALTHFQTWPPPIPREVEDRAQAMERRLRKRSEDIRDGHPNVMGGGFGSMTFSTEPGSRMRGRESFTYGDNGADVQESIIVHDGSEFTLVERIQRDDEAGVITFTLELTGPDGTTAHHDHRYKTR